MPGARIRARVSGAKTVVASMSKVGPVEDTFVVLCDGEEQLLGDVPSATFSTAGWTNGSQVNVSLCTALDPAKVHNIEIFKSTEAMWNTNDIQANLVTFHGLHGEGLKLEEPPARAPHRVEFLGDSITAGYCNLCNDTAGVLAESHIKAWPTLTCQGLGAECHTTAWSGYGMVENCCGGDTLASDVWLRTLASVPSENASDPHGTTLDNEWDFSSWRADAVVINLGTNDGLTGEREALIPDYNATYLSLVQAAAKAYGPETQFFLACGPMSEAYCDPVQWVIDAAKANGIKANFLDHRGFAHPSKCCGHPSADSHEQMAQRTVDTIKKAMNWGNVTEALV